MKLDLTLREDRFLIPVLRGIFGARHEEETRGLRENLLRRIIMCYFTCAVNVLRISNYII
jgi:hypothetical protein